MENIQAMMINFMSHLRAFLYLILEVKFIVILYFHKRVCYGKLRNLKWVAKVTLIKDDE